MRNFLVFAAVSCAVLGAVVSLPTPQHRFSLPSHFSFRTVHVPVQPIAKPGRLTVPTQPKVSHIPVMVSVPQDFVGDSVVVSSSDLKNLPISDAIVTAEKSITVEAPVELTPIVEETVVPEVAEPVQEIVVEEAPIESLVLTDDSFVLTDSEPQAIEKVDVVASEPVATEPEVIDTPIVEEPTIPEPVVPISQIVQQAATTTTISPFETDTFHAYNQFLNTWLQLASVNLNRPDLLRFVNHVPARQPAVTPQEVIEPAPVPVEIVEPVVEKIVEPMLPEVAEPIVIEVVEPVAEEIIEPEIIEIVEPVLTPEIVEKAAAMEVPEEPVTESIEPVVQELVDPEPMFIDDVAEEVAVTDAPLDFATEADIVDIVTEAPIVEAEPTVEPVAEVKKVEIFSEPQPTVLPELTPEIINSNAIAKSITSQNVIQNSFAVEQTPTLLQPIPRFTSRGRFSGYRYSFAHVPQRGSFFLHPQSG